QSDDHVETSGLASAVRAEQADDFAWAQIKREIVDDFARLVAFSQSASRKHYLPSPGLSLAGVSSAGLSSLLAGAAFLGMMRIDTRLPSPPPLSRPVFMSYVIVS